MSICLCGLTADTMLELAAQNKLEVTPATPEAGLFSADPIAVNEALGSTAEWLPKPIEVLVGTAKSRRNMAGISSHVWNQPLPKNSILMLNDELYVTSPEFTLLQQANQLHQANLCQMLGRYLGTWTPSEREERGQLSRTPLTTFEALNDYLLGVGKVQGKGNLRLAMAYTCEGAASAPETSLQLALCLPPELHGLGLLQPTMNYKVDLGRGAQRLYPHESIRIDLCWHHKMFGLEYQGEEHGTRLGDDYARWLAARKEGYELWFVAKEQLDSAAQMIYLGREIAKRIGVDADEHPWPEEEELQDLLDTLVGRKHPTPVSHKKLRKLLASLLRTKS